MSESKAEIRLQERFEAQSDKQSETKSRKPSEVQSDKQSKEQSALQFDDHLVVQSNDETGKSYEVCISCIMIVFSTMVSTEQKNRLKENLSGIETVKIHELPEAFCSEQILI